MKARFFLSFVTLFVIAAAPVRAAVNDKWIFFGDSVTAISLGNSTTPLATLVNIQIPNVSINVVNDGISGLSTDTALGQIDSILAANADAKYVTLNLGTNDTNVTPQGCGSGTTQIYSNFVTLVQKVLAANKIPVVPTIPSAWDATCGSQIVGVINQLYANFPQVVRGPDLWAAFSNRPDLFPTVHPSVPAGVDAYVGLWTSWMVQNIYANQITPTSIPTPNPTPVVGQWQNIDISGVSNSFTNPSNPCDTSDNYGYNTVVLDPTNPKIVYVGTNYQGLYKSTNSGSTWVKIDTGTGSNMVDCGRIWALAVDPFHPNTLYAPSGYGSGGPLKSTDGGISWTHMLPNTNPAEQQINTNDIYNVAVDPYTPDHVLISFHYYWNNNQDTGVLESTDGGVNWIIHPPGGSGWGAGNSVWFLNNSSTWLLGSQNAAYWFTTDSGSSWHQIPGSQNITHGGINSLYRDPATGIIYVGYWHGIAKITINGTSSTWTDFSGPLPYAGYETLGSDGINLYTAPSCPCGGDFSSANGPWFTVSKTDPNVSGDWKAYNSQIVLDPNNGVHNGPVMMAFDSTNHILYSVNWLGGLWRLQTQATLAGDLNGDGMVTIADIKYALQNWLKPFTSPDFAQVYAHL